MNAPTPLFSQCLSRLQTQYARWGMRRSPGDRGCADEEDGNEQLAQRVQKIVQRNADEGRIEDGLPTNPDTGIPDQYVDRVIGYLLSEGPVVGALLAKQSDTWAEKQAEITRMVRRHASACCGLSGERFEELVKDLTQDCSIKIWRTLWRYPYDCALSAWLWKFVENVVRGACRKASFRHGNNNISLDGPPDGSLDGPLLLEALPDERALGSLEKADRELSIEAGMGLLSRLQRLLIEMQLDGSNSREIAVYLNRTLNAIYTIRRRAVEKLHKFVISG
jgi:DNA-directed RNA polymerase specialized sigma24 family protein